MGAQVACKYVAFRSVEDDGTISKVSENFFAGIKVCERDCQSYNKIKLLLVLFIWENEHCVIFFYINFAGSTWTSYCWKRKGGCYSTAVDCSIWLFLGWKEGFTLFATCGIKKSTIYRMRGHPTPKCMRDNISERKLERCQNGGRTAHERCELSSACHASSQIVYVTNEIAFHLE